MKFKRPWRRKNKPDAAKQAPTKIIGITHIDWVHIYNSIQLEYDAAHARQANPDAIPNQYMRGLAKALKIMDTVRPYTIAEVQ